MSETKFKVGDRVKVISLSDGDEGYYQLGNVGTIILFGNVDYYVQFDAPYHYMDGRWFCSYKQLELLDSPKPSSEPNAQLIAAAPDLYEALAALVSWREDSNRSPAKWGDLNRAALAALAKARGEA